MRKVKRLLFLLAFLPVAAFAQQEFEVIRGNCLPDISDDVPAVGNRVGAVRQKLPAINTNWNPEKTYRQMVILVNYVDSVFSCENPKAFFEKILNEPGYNEGNGPGCAADYFRSQSNGMLNLQFDVFGPVKVSQKAQPYENPTSSTKNYADNALYEAANKVLLENPTLDYSVYDWNGNGYINQVIFVCASFSGNTSSPYFNTNGFLWPSTSSISTITTPDGLKISNYSACAELWPTKTPRSCGFSTICHEFSHSLGLPDIYPTNSSAGYSVCDEWDLMDGGNFTNYGWCPVNYTALEKMLMGWLTPVELTEDSLTIEGLKPVEEGGNAYIIKHSDDEWLLLENRQQRGWDAGAPGKGLVIYHVNYSASVWKNNKVNNDATKRRFELVHADNMDYDAWKDYLMQAGLGSYEHSQKMNRRLLSTSPYPWIDDSTGGVLNDSLTDTSVPAAVMFYPGLTGNPLFNKPITNIKMTDEGLISFDFMGGAPVVVDGITTHPFTLHSSPFTCHQIYDLNGRRLAAEPQKGVYVIRKQDGTIRKIFK